MNKCSSSQIGETEFPTQVDDNVIPNVEPQPRVDDNVIPNMEPQAQVHDNGIPNVEDSYLNKYCGVDPETLEEFLRNEDIIYIQPIRIDTTHIKPSYIVKPSPSKSWGVRTFFDKKPIASNSNVFKPLGVVKVSSQKISSSDPISIFTFFFLSNHHVHAFTNTCLL